MTRARDARHVDLAARASGIDRRDAARDLLDREVALAWPERLEESRAGRALVWTAANLIVRFCPRLRIAPVTNFAAEVAEHVVRIDRSARPAEPARTNAVMLHLGGGASLADVTASAEGWIAHVSGYGVQLPVLADAPNVIGAHVGAALAASQVWIRLLPLVPSAAGLAARTAYSVYEYGVPTREAPPLGPGRFRGPVLLGGCGAVGQAAGDVLASAGADGDLLAVDHGFVDDVTNLNRSCLATEADFEARTWKVDLVHRRALRTQLRVRPIRDSIENVVRLTEAGSLPWPAVVATAFDEREPRWTAQDLWPDLVLDAATGDTMAQVFRYEYDRSGCLRCVHPVPAPNGNVIERMAGLMNVPVDRIARWFRDPNSALTEADLDGMPSEIQELARRHLGRAACGFTSELERLLGDRAGKTPALPAVSFTSYLAGAFLAAEILKWAAGMPWSLPGLYQIDPLASLLPQGPDSEAKNPRCVCVVRREEIAIVRRQFQAR